MERMMKPEALLEALGVPWPETEAEVTAVEERAIDMLKTDSKSGYLYVLPVKSSSNPWQAKPYIKPKVQRSLGSFPTARDAARCVVHWVLGIYPTPPSPHTDRNRRGEGRRKRDRSNHGKGALVLPHLLLPVHAAHDVRCECRWS